MDFIFRMTDDTIDMVFNNNNKKYVFIQSYLKY